MTTFTDPSPGNDFPAKTAQGVSFDTTGKAAASLLEVQFRLPPGPAVSSGTGTAYAAVAFTFPEPDRREQVLALEMKMQALDPSIRHLIAAGTEPPEPYVGKLDLPKNTVRALAKFTQEQIEAKRLRDREKRDRILSFIEKAFLIVIGAIIGSILKTLFSSSH